MRPNCVVGLPVLGIFLRAHRRWCMWLHVGGPVRTLYVSALKVDSGRKIPWLHQGVEPVLLLVLCLSFQSDALPAEPSRPLCLSFRSDALPAELSHPLCLSFRSDALATKLSHPWFNCWQQVLPLPFCFYVVVFFNQKIIISESWDMRVVTFLLLWLWFPSFVIIIPFGSLVVVVSFSDVVVFPFSKVLRPV